MIFSHQNKILAHIDISKYHSTVALKTQQTIQMLGSSEDRESPVEDDDDGSSRSSGAFMRQGTLMRKKIEEKKQNKFEQAFRAALRKRLLQENNKLQPHLVYSECVVAIFSANTSMQAFPSIAAKLKEKQEFILKNIKENL